MDVQFDRLRILILGPNSVHKRIDICIYDMSVKAFHRKVVGLFLQTPFKKSIWLRYLKIQIWFVSNWKYPLLYKSERYHRSWQKIKDIISFNYWIIQSPASLSKLLKGAKVQISVRESTTLNIINSKLANLTHKRLESNEIKSTS